MEMEEYSLESFDKDQILEVIECARHSLGEFNIPNSIWHIEPYAFSLQIESNKADSKVISRLYKMRQVRIITYNIEPNSRALLLRFVLKPNWFMEEEERHADRKPVHPENRPDLGGD